MRRYFALVLLAVCPLAFGQAYKWKDAQGVTHYADAPPPGNAKYERVKTSGTVVPPAGNPPAVAPAASTAAKPATGAVADTPQNRDKLCGQLRNNMDVLGKEKVVSIDDGKGGTKPLDDAGRKRQVETTQAQMTLYCK